MRIMSAGIAWNRYDKVEERDPAITALIEIYVQLAPFFVPRNAAFDYAFDLAKIEWDQNRGLARSTYLFANVCDWCSKPPSVEERELSRCSKCIFARYCCKEHQIAPGGVDLWTRMRFAANRTRPFASMPTTSVGLDSLRLGLNGRFGTRRKVLTC